MRPFPIVDVSEWEVALPEPGGSDANSWLIDPDGSTALFKPVVAKAGRRQGEDWAEKAVEQVARSLGIPCATIELAQRRGQSGVLSYNLSDGDADLHSGAVQIATVDDRIELRSKNRTGHNVTNIHAVLDRLPRSGSEPR